MHDMSLNSGERQTATRFDDIRADHRVRYEWANALIPPGGFGLDVFCGNGYGAWLLGGTRRVWAIDGSVDAVRLAEEHYRRPGTLFSAAYWPFELPTACFDFVVSLESIEHVPDGDVFFRALVDSLKPGGQILFSTPCQDLLPLEKTGNHFHHRHYSLAESLAMADSGGLKLIDWAGQNTYRMLDDGRQGPLLADEEMVLRPRQAGQFVMFHSVKERPGGLLRRFLQPQPRLV
jgi:2-polyprenyl-3-methyl-5-hydroxy-6-metoxy-1,4-benzoquinol methylase